MQKLSTELPRRRLSAKPAGLAPHSPASPRSERTSRGGGGCLHVQGARVMDIDAVAGALGVDPLPDAAAAAAAAPHAQLAPLGAFDPQPVAPPPAAGGPSSLPAVHGVAAPVAASGPLAASGGGISFKDVVVGLRNDPSLSDAVKAQISVMSEKYNSNDKQAFFSQLKALVGKERIKQVMIAIKRGAPGASGAADRPPKRGAPDSQEVAPSPNPNP